MSSQHGGFSNLVNHDNNMTTGQFSRSVMSDSLRPCGLQHTRPPCPSPTPEVYSKSCPLSWDAIQPPYLLSSSSTPVFNLSQHQSLFQWVGSLHQVAIYCCFSFSISPFNEYSQLTSLKIDWFDLLAVQGTLRSLLQTTVWRHQIFGALSSLQSSSRNRMWPLKRL